MNKGLIALALGTFALGIAEFVIMGILGNLAGDFDVTDSQAGNIISAYALGVTCGAPALLLARKYELRKILIVLTAIITLGNVFTAFAPNYATLLGARFISGLPHGAYFGVGAIMARHLASDGRQTQAVSIMVAGMTVATVIGVPVGTFLTNHLSWRLTFALVSIAGLITLTLIHAWIKDNYRLPSISFKGQFRFLKSVAPWLIVGGVFFGQTGIYCWYSYVQPMMSEIAGFPAQSMTWIMVVAGLGMFFGNLTSGYVGDRTNPALTSAVIEALSILTMIMLFFFSSIQWAAVVLTFIATAGLFGLGGPLQSLIIKYSKGGEMLGAASIQVAFNVGNAVAAFIGGSIISASLPVTYTALCAIPLLVLGSLSVFILYRRFERNNE